MTDPCASHRARALRGAILLCCALALGAPAAAGAASDPAAQWLPSSDGASWTYEWSNSQYAPQKTRETYTLSSREGDAFRIAWTSQAADGTPGQGLMDFQRTTAGLANLSWSSTAAPRTFPVLCAAPAGCGNSVAGTHFMTIWGTRAPVLAEPLLKGTQWASSGGADNDVTSASRYVGRERIVTAAFPDGVTAARVESDVAQAGALGDPFGTGVRTVHWVYGVGPARVVLRHADGTTTQSDLVATNLQPRRAPSDANYFPLTQGRTMTFRWRNDRHMRRASVQRFTVAAARSGTARVDVKHVSGPIRVAGSYIFSTRTTGVTTISVDTDAAAKVTFPQLGPLSEPRSRRRQLLTALDFASFGLNPVAPVLPYKGQKWTVKKGSRDYDAFAVTGTATVLGSDKVRTPAGRFTAVVVRSRLRQAGTRYGSGTRTAWFAPGKGLVKLKFKHADGSTSTVERLR